MTTSHIAIVEDDPDMRALLSHCLISNGYRVTALENASGIEEVVRSGGVDLFILDIGLPGADGLTVTQAIRHHSDVSIIIVSGRGDLADRVVGLEVGADDYITKPFEPREVQARVKSVLRRHPSAAISESQSSHVYEFGDWILNPASHSLRDTQGHPVELTSGEYKLLETMVMRPNRVLTRDQLMDACYGNNSPAFDRTIDVCMGRLRKKLKDDPRNFKMIRTVRNFGYMFAAPVIHRRSDRGVGLQAAAARFCAS
jgi:DNA-binding response OmpR family regulator